MKKNINAEKESIIIKLEKNKNCYISETCAYPGDMPYPTPQWQHDTAFQGRELDKKGLDSWTPVFAVLFAEVAH